MDNNSDLTCGAHINSSGAVEGLYVETMSMMSSAALDAVIDDILTQSKQVPFRKSEGFCIGDFGCANGATSLEVIQGLLSSLKDHHGNHTSFKIIYEDQPFNDFNLLFLQLDSSFAGLENVFTFACGTSFYNQCVPLETMHVIVSFYAAHWLSRRPTVYKNSICYFADSSEEEKHLLLSQAESDWEQFLLLRTRELKHGGRLFVVVPSDGEPDNKGLFKSHNGKFLKLLSSIWHSFVELGKISHHEYINTNMDTCHYNLSQIQKPFQDTNSSVYKSGLRLCSLRNISCFPPEYLEWKRQLESEGVDDRQTFSRGFVNARRCFTNNVFLCGLSNNRTTEEKEVLVNELFQEAQDVASRWNPEDVKNDMNDVFISLYKT